MSNTDGIIVRKRISVLNRNINVSFKDLFKSLGKALVDFKFGNWDRLGKDGFDALAALGLESDPGYSAWLLIFRSLHRSINNLVEDNQALFTSKYKNFDDIAEQIDFSLEETEIVINADFFNRPKEAVILEQIESPFKQWLQLYGLNAAQATSIYNRLPSYFVFALNQEWRERRSQYIQIEDAINTPFTKAQVVEQSWLYYSAWLQKQVDEPMFLEAFGLRQVYVEPRAYYLQEIEGNNNRDYELNKREEKQYQKVVVELHDYLENWLNKVDKNDAIRIISGDPGAGKSSFAKMFAAKQAEKGEIPILLIPLHHFDPTGDLVEAVAKFIRDDDYLAHNPLAGDLKESRLLIIFDGLDELSMQGKLGSEVARSFINEVQKTVSRINYRQIHLQVIISGRPVVIQSNQTELRKPEQVLHILSYFIPENQINKYHDQDNLLTEDRRDIWWQKYGEVTGNNNTEMPKELKLDSLAEITTQPLLNYLIALSFTRSKNPNIDNKDKIIFSESTNLNAIYEDLLKSVYDRGWDTEQHPTLQGVKYNQFVRILEEIALAAWHGNGRTTTVEEIEAHCESSGLKKLLTIFAESAQSGVTCLLTAFYFRQQGYSKEGDRTFEFTHKSFGEYLTARRILRELIKINRELKNRDDDPDEGWDERQALTRWIMICGMSAIDEYLFEFIRNEIALQDQEKVKQWQKTLANLIGFMLRQGMPMEKINPRPSYQEECQQSRNAEEALLAVLNSCARCTEEISEIKWQSRSSFKKWLFRLQNHIEDTQKTIACQCLSWLNLKGVNLEGVDLKWANLVQTNLEGANLGRADLRWTYLEESNLRKVNLYKADLGEAGLERANLEGATLVDAFLCDADLEGASLNEAELGGADLYGAYLKGVNLKGADLGGADLYRANLGGANLEGVNLEGANLEGAKMDEKLRRELESKLGIEINRS